MRRGRRGLRPAGRCRARCGQRRSPRGAAVPPRCHAGRRRALQASRAAPLSMTGSDPRAAAAPPSQPGRRPSRRVLPSTVPCRARLRSRSWRLWPSASMSCTAADTRRRQPPSPRRCRGRWRTRAHLRSGDRRLGRPSRSPTRRAGRAAARTARWRRLRSRLGTRRSARCRQRSRDRRARRPRSVGR